MNLPKEVMQFKEARLYTYLTMFVVRKRHEDAKYFTVQEIDEEENLYFIKEIPKPKKGTYKVICDNPATPESLRELLFTYEHWDGVERLSL